MRSVGTYISGAMHLALIGWALIAGVFASWDEAPLEVAEVSIISGDEFAALTAPASAPRAATDAPEPAQPRVDPPAAAPQPDTPPQIAPAPVPEPPATPDAAPDLAALAPLPEAEVADEAPAIPAPPVESEGTVVIETPTQPAPAPRVAPQAAPAPPPEADVAEDVRETATPTPEAQPQDPAEPATAPQEAATEIVTEAEDAAQSSFAPLASARPKSRPNRPAAPVRQAETPAEPAAPPSDAINDALAEALGGGAQETTGTGQAPTGPPLTRGEQDALRVAVSRCWNVGSLSSEALRTSVVVGVAMAENGTPRVETIRMISYSGGSGAAALQTYESARRAIIRCGAPGFDLPVEKYAHWRDIEMTFNPEKMRIK